jgi:FkbM family methyltransferase
MKLSLKRILLLTAPVAVLALGLYLLLPQLEERGITEQILKTYPVPKDPEVLRLEEKWGPKKYSQHDEELFILEYFAGREGGVFVDVGAFDYKDMSNTFRLESDLGWSGIAIDALEEFRPGYELHRPNTKFFAYYISDTSSDPAKFYVVEGRRNQSTGVKENADSKTRAITTIEIPQITLDDLLDREGVQQVDFLNMDIELAEPAALRGFDIDRFRPELVCIEAHPPIVDFLDSYFAQHGYEKIKTWSDIDALNNYYARKPSSKGSSG